MSFQPQSRLIDPYEGVRLCASSLALYRRMLGLFAQDQSFNRLKAALRSNQPQEAFLHAHTLKGLSAQLVLPSLQKRCESLCITLRTADETCIHKALKQLLDLEEIYLKTLEEIDAYLSYTCR